MENRVYERLQEITGCSSYDDFEKKFPWLTKPRLSDMRRMNYVAFDLLMALAQEGINPDWLQNGCGKKLIPKGKYRLDTMPLEICPAQIVFVELRQSKTDSEEITDKLLRAFGKCPCVRALPCSPLYEAGKLQDC